jgi:glyoxylase-like metal-dependent hydrolase (beta-lactamase superfamily II)
MSRREVLAGLGAAGVTAAVHHWAPGGAVLAAAVTPARQPAAAGARGPLFRLQRVTESVYAALARPAAMLNCNAAVVVGPEYAVVVDTHSKPSAARALIGQIRAELTDKPVRYVVNTHFHWDHAQGNLAYPDAYGGRTEVVASNATREWLAREGVARLGQSLASGARTIADLERQIAAPATPAAEKQQLTERLADLKAFAAEMSPPEDKIVLPRLTFDKRLVLHNGDLEIHLLFLGRGHTAGDVVVYVPAQRVVASGDLMHSLLPYMGDGFPDEWPRTLTALEALDFDRVAPGHGSVQEGKTIAAGFRAFIEEVDEAVSRGIERGASLEELRRTIAPDRLRSLTNGANGARIQREATESFGAPPNSPLAAQIASNVTEIYNYYTKRRGKN